MIRIDSLVGSVAFAAFVAAASLPWMGVASPLLGTRVACALYLALSVVAYLTAVANERRLRGVVAAAITCAVAALVAGSVTALAMALAAIVGVYRSGLLRRTGGSWAVFRELVLIGGGLLFGSALATTSFPPLAAGLWGFFLVQGFYFLPAVADSSAADTTTTDGFEAAYRSAEELLSRPRP